MDEAQIAAPFIMPTGIKKKGQMKERREQRIGEEKQNLKKKLIYRLSI